MSMEKVEPIVNIVLLALQICLGLWQFMKLTPVGALIRCVIGWLLRPFHLSSTYTLMQCCRGRVFKKVNCYALQADIPSERTGIATARDLHNTITLEYLGRNCHLSRREGNMSVDGKLCYYINDTIWEELHTLEDVVHHGLAASAAAAKRYPVRAPTAARAAAAAATRAAAAAKRAATDGVVFLAPAAAAVAAQEAVAATSSYTVFVKGHRDFWEEVITGGVMSLKEVLDGVILYNQRVSLPLNDHWLLPVNLSVSEEKLLKILNLVALFLQTKRVHVHWLIPISLSFISALLEFSTRSRVWLYTHLNLAFCHVVHFICDPLPRSWRRQIYSLGKWVENLKPCNDIQLKVVRGNIRVIITGGAKIDQGGATLVPWMELATYQNQNPEIEKQFRCEAIGTNLCCTYIRNHEICEISAPTISDVYVDCKNGVEFSHIITFVSCMAKNCCGSLISYGPRNKVRVRGFKESVISYVKSGLPPVYELELENVIVA